MGTQHAMQNVCQKIYTVHGSSFLNMSATMCMQRVQRGWHAFSITFAP